MLSARLRVVCRPAAAQAGIGHGLTTTESIFERNAEGWERFKADMKAHWIDGLAGLQKLRGRLRRIRSELRWNPSKLADRGEAVVSNTLGYS